MPAVQGAEAAGARAAALAALTRVRQTELRFDADRNAFVSDEIQVAYPVVDGVAHLSPHSGFMLAQGDSEPEADGTARE